MVAFCWTEQINLGGLVEWNEAWFVAALTQMSKMCTRITVVKLFGKFFCSPLILMLLVAENPMISYFMGNEKW